MGARIPAIAIALVLAAAPAGAEAAQRRLPGDADGDGRLSLSELQTGAWKLMRRADRDRDGRLDSAEWTSGRTRIRRALRLAGYRDQDLAVDRGGFAKLDADADGFVTAAEADAFFAQRFRSLDRNGDGGVERAELAAALKSPAP
jgi:hypothetical protein